MAAFTKFSDASLRRYLVMFGKGDLKHFEPIAGGIENSNYFVTLEQAGQTAEFVLTIVEDKTFEELPFFSRLTTRLHHRSLPVAPPEATLDGMTSTIFCGKPAFLVRRLPGRHLTKISASHCRQIGEFLAQSQAALSDFGEGRNNPYHPGWMRETAGSLSGIPDQYQPLLEAAATDYEEILSLALPTGLIHGDLFRDNALFTEDGKLSGVIDFYHACSDLLIQDLAVVLNDWCMAPTGEPDNHLGEALIAGYESVRPMTGPERQTLPGLQRLTAVRFALTRFISGDPPLKDPLEMLALADRL